MEGKLLKLCGRNQHLTVYDVPVQHMLMRARGVWNSCPRGVDERFVDAGVMSKSERLKVAGEGLFLIAR